MVRVKGDEVTRACDLALLAHHLAAALKYAKAQNMDAHFIAELDHLINTINYIINEENIEW